MVKAEQSNNSCLYPGEVEDQMIVAQSRRLDNSAVSPGGDELEDS